MRSIRLSAAGALVIALAASAGAARAQDASQAVVDGGIRVSGWTGKIDAGEVAAGMKLEDALLASTANGYHVITGPAVAYWNPANTASGNYTVRATFTEERFQGRNDHPHPYGIVIGGNQLGTDQQTYLYCAAYGSGTFIVRGFGPEPFRLNGPRPQAHDAVHKAAAVGQPVSQDIAVTVTSDSVQCSINGTVVATYPKSEVVGAGKLASTDGVYGFRFGHNTEATVTGLSVTRN